MGRLKAALIHLAISFAVIGSIVLLVIWLWYPPGLLRMTGTPRIMALLAAVDIAAGPLLTLIVYKVGKSSLRFDLTVIAVLQAALLAYGVWTLAKARPVYLVAAETVGRIDLVRAVDIAPEHLAEAPPAYRRLPWTGPRWVAVAVPDTPEGRARALDDFTAGIDLPFRPSYYVPYESVREAMLLRARDVASLQGRLDGRDGQRLERELARIEPRPRHFLPIASAHGGAVALLDDTGRVLRVVGVDPWVEE